MKIEPSVQKNLPIIYLVQTISCYSLLGTIEVFKGWATCIAAGQEYMKNTGFVSGNLPKRNKLANVRAAVCNCLGKDCVSGWL